MFMPRFAANLSMLFPELPFLERFAAARRAGVVGVAFQFPYAFSATDLARRQRQQGLEVVLFNAPPGAFEKGERGLACLPGRRAQFRDSIDLAVEYALAFGARRLHVMAGVPPAGADPAECRAVYLDNLRHAAAVLAPHGIVAVIEPINQRDMPGYFLATQAQAHAIREEAGVTNLKVLMDFYHCQVAEGDIAMKLRQYIDHVGHIQVAGAPGRNEPDRGEVNYPYLFDLVDELGFDGWIGCEYRPAAETVAGLGWMPEGALTPPA
jgi:hydroxypyruvate isomerase